MPSIENLITGLGYHKGAGPNFYLPNPHPHVHIGVNNAATVVVDLKAVRPHITFISLSWGGAPPTVNLYQRNPPHEQLENGVYSVNKKTNFEYALYAHIGLDTARDIQRTLNRLTGFGIDL